MDEKYFTIAGCDHYYGSEFMEKRNAGKTVVVKYSCNTPT